MGNVFTLFQKWGIIIILRDRIHLWSNTKGINPGGCRALDGDCQERVFLHQGKKYWRVIWIASLNNKT